MTPGTSDTRFASSALLQRAVNNEMNIHRFDISNLLQHSPMSPSVNLSIYLYLNGQVNIEVPEIFLSVI